MLRGHGSDDALAGGASVVVRDGESPLHGEGKQFECVCDVCGGKVKREKKWKSVNRSFRGEFHRKNCDRHFRVTIRCKQFYDRLDVRKTFKEILPEEKNPVPIPVKTEKSEA